MGHHYVPQKYLKAFEDPNAPACVWQFDKQAGKFSTAALAIKQIAQERSYYDEAVEVKLNELVECPANPVLDKLRSGSFELSKNERASLSVYMATMIKRVPKNRRRGFEAAPQALANVAAELRDQIRELAQVGQLAAEKAEKHLAETDAVESKFAASPPLEIIEQIENPWPSEAMVQLIFAMHWRFVAATGRDYFLTCDNPAYFFSCYGLGTDNSELTFPVSPVLALFGSWTPIRSSDCVVTCNRFVKEANRRLASGATRFVFSRARADWIETIAMKNDPYLSRINWGPKVNTTALRNALLGRDT